MNSGAKKTTQQTDFQVLSGFEQIKALAHPERLRILNHLRELPLTGSMLAERLGIPANRAHYHLRQLVERDLVVPHGTGRKRWKEERFYLASARHYLFDPAIACDDSTTTDTLRMTAETCFGDWRRDEILDIDLSQIAARVVQDCLRTRSGEQVLVTVNPVTLGLAEAVVVELEARGARPYLKPWSWNLLARTIARHSAESLANLPFLDPAVDGDLAACIHLSSTTGPAASPTEEQRALLSLRLEALSRWHRSLRERRIRYVEISLPHRNEFRSGSISIEDGLDTFWESLQAEPQKLSERANQILEAVRESPRLLLRRGEEERLDVEIDVSRYRVCDGVISDEDIDSGQVVDNLPTGCLFLVPRRGTASGSIRADYTYLHGEHVPDVHLQLHRGALITFRAGDRTATLQKALTNAVGEARVLAEIAIGLNPAGGRLTGKATLDSCLDGVVTLTFGNNELLDGDVRSTLTLNLPCEGLTVTAGETRVL